MSSVSSLSEQLLETGAAVRKEEEYPFIRRDKQVRAKILSSDLDRAARSGQILIETWYDGCNRPTRRMMDVFEFDNNFWRGES